MAAYKVGQVTEELAGDRLEEEVSHSDGVCRTILHGHLSQLESFFLVKKVFKAKRRCQKNALSVLVYFTYVDCCRCIALVSQTDNPS